MSLIKYVLMHKNKKLIMNSRVTIFQHAKESYIELNSFIDTEKVRLQYIDMDSMTIEDKGRIFIICISEIYNRIIMLRS